MRIRRLLLAEDDLDIQKVVRMSLRVRGVTDVMLADNGEDCLRLVK